MPLRFSHSPFDYAFIFLIPPPDATPLFSLLPSPPLFASRFAILFFAADAAATPPLPDIFQLTAFSFCRH